MRRNYAKWREKRGIINFTITTNIMRKSGEAKKMQIY